MVFKGKSFFKVTIFALYFIFGVTFQTWAGGAIQVDINGNPLLWDAGQTLLYNPENGALKSQGAFDQQASLDMLQEAFETWTLLPSSQLTAMEGRPLDDLGLPDGVNQTNYEQFLGVGTEACYPEFFGATGVDCLSPILFDEDGEIIDDLFGTCAKFSILGFAGPDSVEDGSGDPARRVIRRGQALFSGACLDPVVTKSGCGPCGRPLSSQEMRTIVTHEVGHLMGMDHSQVNPQVFMACNTSAEGCAPEINQGLPTMFPILVDGAQMLDLHQDDKAYFTRLYGDPLSQGCSVSGKIFASDGVTELRGAEVVAVNTNPNLEMTDRVSFVSGAEAPKKTSFGRAQNNCTENCGAYTITQLTAGETYQLCVQKINAQFTGGSSIEPVDPPFQGFSDVCPEGLTVTCQCETVFSESGAPEQQCEEIAEIHITTDANPEALQGDDDIEQMFDSGSTGGGCSLHKSFPKTGLWSVFRKTLLNP